MPERWRSFVAHGDPHGELVNWILHQGSIYSVVPKLLPHVIELAKQSGERRLDALAILFVVMESPQARRGVVAKPVDVPNPFRRGETLTVQPAIAPDEALRDGRAAKEAVIAERDAWISLSAELEGEELRMLTCLLAELEAETDDPEVTRAIDRLLDRAPPSDRRALRHAVYIARDRSS